MQEIKGIGVKNIVLSKQFTTTCEDLGILNFDSNKSTFISPEQCKDSITESYLISVIVGHNTLN